jgi:hypothetical protein
MLCALDVYDMKFIQLRAIPTPQITTLVRCSTSYTGAFDTILPAQVSGGLGSRPIDNSTQDEFEAIDATDESMPRIEGKVRRDTRTLSGPTSGALQAMEEAIVTPSALLKELDDVKQSMRENAPRGPTATYAQKHGVVNATSRRYVL